MNEPTEIKYPLDENGEPYFAATHIKAVAGMDTGDFIKKESIKYIVDELDKIKERTLEQDDLIADLQKEIQKILTVKVEGE